MALNGLLKITDKIYTVAQDDADRILQEAQATAEQLAAEYEEKAEAIRRDYEERAQNAAVQMVSDAKAASEEKRQQLLAKTQQEQVDALFARTLENMCSLKSEQYVNLLVGLLCGAFWEQVKTKGNAPAENADSALTPTYEVMMNPRERAAYGEDVIKGVKKRLMAKLGEEKLSCLKLSKRTVRIENGFILLCNGKEIDYSLETIFKDIQEELGEAVRQTLFAPPRSL